MRITRENVEELQSVLVDLLEGTGPEVYQAADVWLDEDGDRDDRADARETIELNIDELEENLVAVLLVLNRKRVAA